MKNARFFSVFLGLWITLSFLPRGVLADEYDESQSHPLRITAYVVHPFGVALEWLVTRPFHALVSATPATEYVFGHRDHPPLFPGDQPAYDYGVAKRVSMKEMAAPKRVVREEPVAERVSVKEVVREVPKEVSVQKTVFKEVPKVVEVERLVLPNVAFRFDSAELSDVGKGQLYLVSQRLKDNTDLVVAIEGHADQIGTEEYNMQLGLHRAETVKRELEQLGIDPARMSVTSLGKSQPLVDQPEDWARALNRRVELKIKAP